MQGAFTEISTVKPTEAKSDAEKLRTLLAGLQDPRYMNIKETINNWEEDTPNVYTKAVERLKAVQRLHGYDKKLTSGSHAQIGAVQTDKFLPHAEFKALPEEEQIRLKKALRNKKRKNKDKGKEKHKQGKEEWKNLKKQIASLTSTVSALSNAKSDGDKNNETKDNEGDTPRFDPSNQTGRNGGRNN